jgi:integrase
VRGKLRKLLEGRDSMGGERVGWLNTRLPGVLRVLLQALSKAESKGYVGKNPADARLVNRPVGAKSTFEKIDPALGNRILASVDGVDPSYVAAHLALGLGLRRQEVLGLTWSDVDADTIRVRAT